VILRRIALAAALVGGILVLPVTPVAARATACGMC